jgi:hypothetical protein
MMVTPRRVALRIGRFVARAPCYGRWDKSVVAARQMSHGSECVSLAGLHVLAHFGGRPASATRLTFGLVKTWSRRAGLGPG